MHNGDSNMNASITQSKAMKSIYKIENSINNIWYNSWKQIVNSKYELWRTIETHEKTIHNELRTIYRMETTAYTMEETISKKATTINRIKKDRATIQNNNEERDTERNT